MSTIIRINKAHYPVTVLGPGKRIGIWLQGCSIGCKGCVSQDTWPADPRQNMKIADLLAWCQKISNGDIDGITLSGGEPFDQPKALEALLIRFDAWRNQHVKNGGRDFDLLCYSGYPYPTLQKRYGKILARLDALIPEPYAEGLPQGEIWRGSSNQTLIPLSERGERIYAPWIEAQTPAEKRMQVAVEAGRIFLIGIPGREDMEKLEAMCASRGLNLNDVSWRR